MNILETALWYSKKGWPVIPITPAIDSATKKGKKRPLLPTWEEFQKKVPTENEIVSWWQRWPDAMIGVVTGEFSNIFAIDCDTEIAYQKVQEYLPESLILPVVQTPRGGKHLWFSYPKNSVLSIASGILPGVDYRGIGGYIISPPSTNGNNRSYQWLIEPQEELPEIPEALLELILNISKYKGKVNPVLQSVTSVTSCDIWESGTRDENLFHIANCLIKTRNDEEYVRQTLMAITKSWGETDERWIEAKVQSALKRVQQRDENLHREVYQWVSVTSGDFSVTSCYNSLQVVTKDQKATIRQAINRLYKEGYIQKVGNRDGIYRLKNVVCEKIDFINADTTPYLVKWPLNVHELVTLYSRSLVVIAGSPQAGKTAFLLNTAWKNKDNFNIQYFSSEMWDAELKIRLLKFPHDLKDWGKINFQWKTQNFQDSIDPNGFNIVDYLTVNKDFFEIAGLLDEIFCSLKSGIAVVAIQKPMGRDIGVGGERTLDKARLYLAVGGGELKIIKGKLWACDEINPDGMKIQFRLGGGCNFRTEGPWKHT